MRALDLTIVILAGCASAPPPPPRPLPPLATSVPAEYAAVPRLDDDPTITPPKSIHRVHPKPLMGAGVLTGSATVEMVIDEEGRVVAVWYTAGDRLWARVVVDAVRQWRWEPATRGGKPIAVRSTITTTVTSKPGR